MRELFLDGTILIEEQGASSEEDIFYFRRKTDGECFPITNSLQFVPRGIQSYSSHIGVCAHGSLDFTIVKLNKLGIGKGVYTKSLTAGDAVIFDRKNTAQGDIQLLCVISKNSCVFTPNGARDIQTIADELAEAFDVSPEHVVISCTGVIGVPLPMQKVVSAIQLAKGKLAEDCLAESAKAILTTDRQEKVASVKFDEVIICGYAKGAGMIEPNMATMLTYFYTNVDISKEQLDTILRRAVGKSFNSISVDSDTSTSDTVVIMSTQEIKLNDEQLEDFERALTAISIKLARDIVGQAEGGSKIIEAEVEIASSEAEAKLLVKQILNSPLIKTAVYGADPNWGRIVMAVGKPINNLSDKPITAKDLVIEMMGTKVFDRGQELATDLKALSRKIKAAKSVSIHVQIGEPKYRAKGWGCDLTERYVEINSQYTT